MNMTRAHLLPGFDLSNSIAGDVVIRYRTTGMRGLGVFLAIFLAEWTAMALLLTAGLLSGHVAYLPFALVFWLSGFGVLGIAAWHRFSVLELVMEADRFVVRQTLLWYRRGWIFLRSNVDAVAQVKDGGEGEDSFPSWGLIIEAAAYDKILPDRLPALIRYIERSEAAQSASSVTILSQQPIGKSDWLGPIVATWAGVPFEPAAKRR